MKFLKSVKFRLTLWYALVLAVLLSVFTFLLHAEFARALYRDADRNLFQEATSLEASIPPYLRDVFGTLEFPKFIPFSGLPESSSPPWQQKLFDSLQRWEQDLRMLNRSTLMIRIVAYNHSVILSNLTGWEGEIIFPDFERDATFMEKGISYQTIHFKKKPIRLYYHRISYRGNPLFVIQCGKSLYEVEGALARLFFVIVMWIPVAVVAACLAGWFLARRSFRPIDHMIDEAQQITAATLKGRLPRTHTSDELDRLASTLNEMIDRIERSTRAVREFSIDVSHELKTPLAIIRGEIDLALRRSRSPETLQETLRVIEGEVNELIRLVEDLMLLVRSDSQQLQFEKNVIDLRELLHYVVQRFRKKAQEKGIDLTVLAEQDARVYGDDGYLKRLFSNLLDNAIKFTPPGGWVRVKLDADKKKAKAEVSDNGQGIELEIQEKVFSRFFRTDQARSHEGAGLGLNISKAICDAHGGHLSIESQPQQGTKVFIEFPLI